MKLKKNIYYNILLFILIILFFHFILDFDQQTKIVDNFGYTINNAKLTKSQDFILIFFIIELIVFFILMLVNLRQKIKNLIIILLLVISIFLYFDKIVKLRAPIYLTDSAVFFHYAGLLYNNSLNPYNYNMLDGLKILNIPDYISTKLNNGERLNKFTYPPGAFIFSGLLLKIGVKDLRYPALWFMLAIFLISSLLIKKNIFKLLFILSFFANTSIIWLTINSLLEPFWTIFVYISYLFLTSKILLINNDLNNEAPRSKSHFLLEIIIIFFSAISLAIAVSIKQTAFYCAAFLVIYAYKKLQIKNFVYFICIFSFSLFLINGYYFFNNYHIISNIFLPAIDLPLVSFSFSKLNYYMPNLTRELFLYMQIALTLFLLIFFLLKFDRLRFAIFIFPMIILLFNWRCMPQYFYCYFLLAIISLIREYEITFT